MGLKRCLNCSTMHPSAKRACGCGYQFEIKSKKFPQQNSTGSPFNNPNNFVPSSQQFGKSSTNYSELLIQQQQQMLKQLAAQTGPLSTTTAAAVANLLQVTSAALANGNSASASITSPSPTSSVPTVHDSSSVASLFRAKSKINSSPEASNVFRENSVGSADDQKVCGKVGDIGNADGDSSFVSGMGHLHDQTGSENDHVISPGIKSEALSGGTLTPNSVNGASGINGITKDNDDGFVTESMNVYPDNLGDKLDDRDNLEIDESEFESSEMDTTDLPVDLTSQCQETVESYMKLVGEGSYNCEFGGNTATVVQQIPVTNDDSFSATNGPGPAISAQKLSNASNAVYKRRGRPPGWRKQHAMELAGARTDSDSGLPTMVTSNMGCSEEKRTALGLAGAGGVKNIGYLQSVRNYPTILPGPGAPKSRGRPRGSMNKMYASREYMAIARVLHQYKQQLKQFTINKIKSQYKPIAPNSISSSNNVNQNLLGDSSSLNHDTCSTNELEQRNVKDEANSEPCSGGDQNLSDVLSDIQLTPSNFVTLDVGGSMFCTANGTLMKAADSNLTKITLGTGENGPNFDPSRQCYVIDRDPTVFQHILNYLRNNSLKLPEDFKNFDLLLDDCKFYNIPGMYNEVEALRNKLPSQTGSSPVALLESSYLLLESFDRGQKIEISGRKQTINKLFDLNSDNDRIVTTANAVNNEDNSPQYYQNYPLTESLKSLTSAQAVDVVLTNKNFKLFKIAYNSIDNQPITSYHFISQ